MLLDVYDRTGESILNSGGAVCLGMCVGGCGCGCVCVCVCLSQCV